MRDGVLSARCDFVIAEVISMKSKERVFSADSHEETQWILRQVGTVEGGGK